MVRKYNFLISIVFFIFLISLLLPAPLLAQTCTDNDLDTYSIEGGACGPVDCDDNDATVYPGAQKLCDGKDNNCDGRLDFTNDVDDDSDGYAKCAECDDNNPNVNPGVQEGPFGDATCTNGLDDDCDFLVDEADPACGDPCLDEDLDGFGANGDPLCPNGPAVDCNDNNASINPGASDANCNGIDENCDTTPDDGYVITPTNCGVGICASTGSLICFEGGEINTCAPSTPGVEGPEGDPTCNDTLDNDCDGDTDGADSDCASVCIDNDSDGYGSNGHATCPNGTAIDCNDNDGTINPGASDNNCNLIDEDCSGVEDDGYVITPTNCGVGACASSGQLECQSGVEVDTCVAGSPAIEGPLGDPNCSDAIDNDCDGTFDDDISNPINPDQNCLDPCVDNDSDGFGNPGDPACPNGPEADCDDTDSAVYPGAQKICDAKDNNCDGRLDFSSDVDNDSDGYAQCGECDDTNPNVNPGQIEAGGVGVTCSNGFDDDCDFLVDLADPGCVAPCLDNDSDGYGAFGDPLCPNGPAVDCNDNNPSINPGASDANCNTIDEDCSGTADDGYVITPTNCGEGECASTGQLECQSGVEVDTCVAGSPGVEGPEGDPTCTDTLDNDCDGQTDAADGDCAAVCIDNDSDGYGSNGHVSCPNGTAIDCNDNDGAINPGASDANCNNIDENCDTTPDDGYVVTPTNCGVGACASTGQLECQSGVEVDTCVAGTPGIEGPLGDPNCTDAIDNDCDGTFDDDIANPVNPDQNCLDPCVDNDSDGFGSPGDPSCPNGSATDCDDTDTTVFPGAPKICDAKDNDCDGRLDFTNDVDGDSDGYAKCAECDDTNPNVNPGAIEGPFGDATCSNGFDDDCDFLTDVADPGCGDPCLDNDSDGYGSNGDPLCPNGTAIDCNDDNASINPGASDASCNNVDEDCSGVADDGYVITPTNCGVGVCASTGQLECQSGVEVDTCVAGSPGVEGPEGDPTCTDTLDNDCDNLTDGADDNCASVCIDNDSDGYGSNGHATCPNGTAIDCNDNNPSINPGASDTNCNTVDEDCSGVADDGYVITPTNCGVGVCASTGQLECLSGTEVDTCVAGTPGIEGPQGDPTCSNGLDDDCDLLIDAADPNCQDPCVDNDSDGFGLNGDPSCPNGTAIDCDDTDPAVYPGALKICDGKDNNCDGRLDFASDVDNDSDGYAVCAGDCNDTNPNINPGVTEGPLGDPTCSDGLDNDCDTATDSADGIGIPNCAPPSCETKHDQKDGPHLFDLYDKGVDPVDPADDILIKLSCQWCHFDDSGTIDERTKCERCHADPAWGGPDDGTLKVLYPDNPPYGFGNSPNARLHSSSVLGTTYGPWDMHCLNCHNPHLQEQNANFGTTYGKYIKEYICFDNPVTSLNIEELITFTAPSGPGSFADGPPHNENICEMCHTQTAFHQNNGSTPLHNDSTDCADCHLHVDGFKASCDGCHEAPPPTGSHLKHFNGDSSIVAYGDTGITQDYVSQGSDYIMNCGNCHPMDSANHQNSVLNSGGGDAQIELYNPNAPAGSLKGLNPPSATYTPGGAVMTDARGFKYTTGTCDNVYCHSVTDFSTSGPVPFPTPYVFPLEYNPPWQDFIVTSTAYQTTPVWGTSTDPDGLMCNNCHGYPIITEFPTVSAGVGDSHAWKDDFGNIDLHMWNMSWDPLQCNTCHFDTVQADYTWDRTDTSMQILIDIPIFNTSKHVNGTTDVIFNPTPVLYPGTSKGDISHDLNSATYDPITRTCFNVSCHYNQTEAPWGHPYRYWNDTECDVCHRFL